MVMKLWISFSHCTLWAGIYHGELIRFPTFNTFPQPRALVFLVRGVQEAHKKIKKPLYHRTTYSKDSIDIESIELRTLSLTHEGSMHEQEKAEKRSLVDE